MKSLLPIFFATILMGCVSSGLSSLDSVSSDKIFRGSQGACLQPIGNRQYTNQCAYSIEYSECQAYSLSGHVRCFRASGNISAQPYGKTILHPKADYAVACKVGALQTPEDKFGNDQAFCNDGGGRPEFTKQRTREEEEARQANAESIALALQTFKEVQDTSQARAAMASPNQQQHVPSVAAGTLPASGSGAGYSDRQGAGSASNADAQRGGYNVALGPKKERVNVPGHLGCISMEAVPRQNQNLTQTFRVKNGCPMPLRVQYCYGNGCTKALGAGEEIASGEIRRIYVERSYGYVLRLLQACSLMSGSDPISYLSPTNQCSAAITMQ